MCKYCEWDPEYSDDGIGFYNDVSDAPIMINDVEIAKMILSVGNSKKKGARLEVELNMMPSDDPKIAKIVTPIKYCPFCGKKLVEE